jgi:nucleotide-binding universal stress UspA family protein
VATDGSPHARQACAFAVDLAARFDAELVAVHVAVPVLRSSLDRPRQARQAEAAARAQGERVLEEARAMAGDRVSMTTA